MWSCPLQADAAVMTGHSELMPQRQVTQESVPSDLPSVAPNMMHELKYTLPANTDQSEDKEVIIVLPFVNKSGSQASFLVLC